MWPIIQFDNLVYQHLFQAICSGEREDIQLSNDDFGKIYWDFSKLNSIYNMRRDIFYFYDEIFSSRYYNKTNINSYEEIRASESKIYVGKDALQYFFEKYEQFNHGCENRDENAVLKSIQLGEKFHVYSSEPFEIAVFERNYNLADFLLKNDTSLNRWPGLLYAILQREYDEACHLYYGKEDFTGKTTDYAIQSGAIVNHIQLSHIPETPLDLALRIKEPSAIKILKSAGAKTAKEILNERHQEC